MTHDLPGVSSKLPVLEDILVELVADFVEIVHVELPDEGGEVFVAKVDGQDLLFEALHVQDGEVGAVFTPADYVGVDVVLSGDGRTSRISKVLAMKMEGPESFSLLQRPRRAVYFVSRGVVLDGIFFYWWSILEMFRNII